MSFLIKSTSERLKELSKMSPVELQLHQILLLEEINMKLARLVEIQELNAPEEIDLDPFDATDSTT